MVGTHLPVSVWLHSVCGNQSKYVWLALALGVASVPQPDSYQLLVNLFNALFVDSDVSFEYEFGSGVPLLHGKATVTLTTPLELLPNSTVSYPDDFTQLCSLQIKVAKHFIVSRDHHADLVLSGCQMELDVIVRNSSDWRIEPVLVWVHNCSSIRFSSGASPPVPEQILPTLSQGIFKTAVELFKKDFDESEDIKTDPSQNFGTFQNMFPVLMYLKGRPVVTQQPDQD